MSTVTRNLSNIDGANVTNPDANSFTTNGLVAYANDAAFEAVTTPQAGSIYWNTTEQLVRQYNGTSWQNDKTSFETQNDSTTTGSLQTITPTATAQIIRFTQGSLASIRAIVPTIQKVLYLVNGQASTDIVIKNEDAGATAAQRIVTGSGNDFTLKPTQMLALVYDGVGLRWRLAGGGSGGGLIPTAQTANFAAVAGINYLTDTSGGPITATLPAGTNGSTIRFVDATESWGTNNLTITPASGQTIDMFAADETLVCDVIRGWVELSWDGTRWAFSSLASTTVGFATASTPGTVSTAAQSFGGLKTFHDGLKLDEGAEQTTLNNYQVDDTTLASVQWDPNGSGVNSSSFAVKCTRIGRIVTLTFPRSNDATGAGGTTNSLSLTVTLASAFRPASILSFPAFIFHNGAAEATPGLLEISSAGVVTIFRTITGTAFGVGQCGLERTSITYTV